MTTNWKSTESPPVRQWQVRRASHFLLKEVQVTTQRCAAKVVSVHRGRMGAGKHGRTSASACTRQIKSLVVVKCLTVKMYITTLLLVLIHVASGCSSVECSHLALTL